MAVTETTPPADEQALPEAVRRRLTPLIPRDPISWVWTAAVALVAAVLRLVGLTTPRGKIFDEVYYATDAHSLLEHGFEWDDKNNSPAFVVHPPLGKWCIAIGEKLFGDDEFGWRIASVVAGVAAVVVITRLARRMFGSTVLGCAAGLLMTLDGFQFVLARTALLDIFLLTFVVASFACLVADRDQRRARWVAALEAGRKRPAFQIAWWRIGSAVLLGCALATKWSAVWFAVAFVIMIVCWEVSARRSGGEKQPLVEGLLSGIAWAATYTVVTMTVYVASWTGWLSSDNAYDRHWMASQGKSESDWPFVGALYNLYQYHRAALDFHTGLEASHPYQSWPMQWLLLSRPVAFHYSGDPGCGAAQCSSEVLLLGTPLLWWSFVPALLGVIYLGISRRDWRAWPIVAGGLLGIVPWLFFGNRTMFYFYAAPSEPFLILAVTFVLGAIVGSGAATATRRTVGAIVAGGYVGLVAICFAYFYPIYTGRLITYASWWARMWLGNHWV
ncbi:phospholipid carrier-dependent glycosyltransferase [Longispora fulva]|uniref:Polyprenol-phosphate-mannose--protein mannosyltransferase n=1 Tax=Longispora fulva TaxID=619741 RepID=A0A8J7GV19_9ACTN|nr:glycosyltransferase family 39 protein [Longispora fulva]MBG6139019.1 dolichyl-phosphate-mannose--protein O-mannosyl transferase [Longispora fulva]GIG58512.1 phospholipid carrier-dependent glycosyltransferase [Longispora fulva]